ncbi:hypothetical protein JCM3774_006376 [Rhodotorula dairenensis]
MSSSSTTSTTTTATAAHDDDDDEETWDEASDEDLPASLGGLSLKPLSPANGHKTSSLAPIQTRNFSPETSTANNRKSPQSASYSGSTWSFNPFSMRPSAVRPLPAAASSSSFFGSAAAAAASSSTVPLPSSSSSSSTHATPSALYAYARAAPPTAAAAGLAESPASPTSPGKIVSPSLGAEAVAAALAGRPPLVSHSSATRGGGGGDHLAAPRRGASYLAGASRVQEEADRCVVAAEQQQHANAGKGDDPPALLGRKEPWAGGAEQGGRRSSVDDSSKAADAEESGATAGGYAKEKCRRAVRKDVADLVRDPGHVLARLKVAWQPRPTPVPSSVPTDSFRHTRAHSTTNTASSDGADRSEISLPLPDSAQSATPAATATAAEESYADSKYSRRRRRRRSSTNGVDGSGDDSPPRAEAGYVPLNVSSLSSHDANLTAVVQHDDDHDNDDDHAVATTAAAGGDGEISSSSTAGHAPDPREEEGERGRENRRKRKFLQVLEGEHPGNGGGSGSGGENVDLTELRKLAWSGVPNELRPMVWQLLLGYLPAPTARRASTLARKRSEYASLVKQAFSRGVTGLDSRLWHQISIDVPRTRPGVPLWQAEATQRSLERVLYVWAIRHPASGYVQGINDLATPFFQVFLASYIDADPESFDVSVLAPEVLEALEADSFWCLSKLLDGIQDNYIFAQPGIQRLVKKMETLCARVDAPLAAHLKEEGVEFIQFAFRWMNCLLMRELSVKNIVRMWDTYLAEGGDAFSDFHLYVCLAFLVRWSDQLREMDFQSIIMFLQSLPTQDWSDKDTELLLSEAFMWSRTFVAR